MVSENWRKKNIPQPILSKLNSMESYKPGLFVKWGGGGRRPKKLSNNKLILVIFFFFLEIMTYKFLDSLILEK